MAASTIYYHDIRAYKYRLSREHREQVPIYGREGGTPFMAIDARGTLWFHVGYCWDGPSGPTIDTPGSMRPSLIHDALYALLKMGVLPPEAKEIADIILRDAYIEDALRVLEHERQEALASRVEGRWFGGMRDWFSDKAHDTKVAVVRARAWAWYVAVRMAGSAGDQPSEQTAPV